MASTERKYGHKSLPQLSSTQMANYLTASPGRRKSIIREARFPKTSVVAQYAPARVGIVNFLVDGTRSFRHFTDADEVIERRRRRTDPTDWLLNDCKNSSEALASFQAAYNKLNFKKYECRKVAGRLKPLGTFATRISVDLDLTIHRPRAGTSDQIGGAMFFFNRGEASASKRADRGKIIAGIISLYCQEELSALGETDPALCWAVDVFGGIAHKPAGRGIQLAGQIREAADEIADRWYTIMPPDDYDGPEPTWKK